MSTYITRGNTLHDRKASRSLEELEDRENDVVDVAEPGGFGLFRVVQTTGPVNADLVQTLVEARGGVWSEERAKWITERGARVHGAEIVNAVENGVVRFVGH